MTGPGHEVPGSGPIIGSALHAVRTRLAQGQSGRESRAFNITGRRAITPALTLGRPDFLPCLVSHPFPGTIQKIAALYHVNHPNDTGGGRHDR